MAYSTAEGRRQILDDLAEATSHIAFALACLGAAYEQLDERTADRLEEELFGPVQKAYAAATRASSAFATRHGLAAPAPEPRTAGVASQSAKALIENAMAGAVQGAHAIGDLQDTMLPVEVGDAELRAGLAEVRQVIDTLPSRARELTRVLGR
jgi:hypothetical protein